MKRYRIFVSILCMYFTCVVFLWKKEYEGNGQQRINYSLDFTTGYVYEQTTTLYIGSSREINYWRPVSNSDTTFYFSAFSDNKTGVHLFGAMVKGLRKAIYCCFHKNSSDSSSFHIRTSTHRMLPETKGLRYGAAKITCPLPPSVRPQAVSLSIDQCKTPSNILPIIYPEKQKRQFTVCITPLNYRYSKAYELVEMIELNRLLGAEYFTFYNYSTDYNVDKVLEYYKKLGIVEVLEWNLPMKVDTWPRKKEPVEIHYFGQLAALNDCLYRNMFLSKYIVFEDLDEFIIPRKHLTWPKMMAELPKEKGAYIFRCFFFRKEWKDTEINFTRKDLATQYKMNTLLKLKREAKLLGKTHRAKYIVQPSKVDTVGIHNIWRFMPGNSAHFVDSDFARLHHYRDWLNPKDEATGIYDDRMMVYKDQLIDNTAFVWEKLKNIPLGPLNDV